MCIINLKNLLKYISYLYADVDRGTQSESTISLFFFVIHDLILLRYKKRLVLLKGCSVEI